ncbi:MAG: hypothetical protein ACM3YM_04110, partial [Sphingomonadales bacterium]
MANDHLTNLRAQLRPRHRAPEPEVVAALLPQARFDREARERVERQARIMLAELRGAQ